MKIIFCTTQIFSSGGIERVILNRVNYLTEKYNYEIIIIVTDWNLNKDTYFYLNPKVKVINLEINYLEFLKENKNFFIKIFKREVIKKEYKKRLKQILEEERPDILVSMGDISREVCYKFNKLCKTVIEHHITKSICTGYMESKGIKNKIKYYIKNYQEKSFIQKYDRFLVLTEEDKNNWNNSKIKVINNPISFITLNTSECNNKKVISVGRLDKQKGFDMLIESWKKVNEKHSDWKLEIYGEGELGYNLQNKINELKLEKTIILKGNTNNIEKEYLSSSIYVMSSRYEGMPMVLLEAMHCGLPLVSFNCPCGPSDIISERINGYLCECFDLNKMAERIIYLIEHPEIRKKMGEKSRELSFNYSEDKIMEQWKNLFDELIEEK